MLLVYIAGVLYHLPSCFMFSRAFKPSTDVAHFLLDAGKLLPSLPFTHFLWTVRASALISFKLQSTLFITSLYAITF